jgi:SAM-dependent methyltransferase
MSQNKAEKPQYGWYGGNFVKGIAVLGLAGLLLLAGGFIILSPFSNLLLITGLALCILFLWPTIGLIVMNLWIFSKKGEENYNFLKRFSKPKVLDCGCGTGRHAIELAKYLPPGGHLTGIDIYNNIISGNSLERVKRNAELEGVESVTDFQHGSITDIPFSNEQFDIISIQSVLHELHGSGDMEKALSEVKRVLKKDGLLTIGEWHVFSMFLLLTMGVMIIMMALFVFKSKNYWRKRIASNGFRIGREINHNGFIIFSCQKTA